ncbi:MAG: biotin/lipoyl-binding protein [Chloroflexi bacterium]|nr:biotin/lipoyl-binding protein [Chloroflexota bacterium]
MRYFAEVEGSQHEVEIVENATLSVAIDGQPTKADLQRVDGPSLYSLILDQRSYEVYVEQREGKYMVMIGGELYWVKIQDERARRLAEVAPRGKAQEGEVVVRAPMPGLVKAIEVAPGDVVAKGQGLIVLEAMKMENELRAPQGGTIRSLNVAQGETVELGRVLVVLG